MKNARGVVGERHGKKSFPPSSAMVGSISPSSACATASSSPALATISIATTKPLLRSAGAYLAAFMRHLTGFPDCVDTTREPPDVSAAMEVSLTNAHGPRARVDQQDAQCQAQNVNASRQDENQIRSIQSVPTPAGQLLATPEHADCLPTIANAKFSHFLQNVDRAVLALRRAVH